MNDPLDHTRERGADELLPLVYDELRRLARFKMSAEAGGQTLQATALVHEAYLRLVSAGDRAWPGRRYFFAAAAEAMRRILIEKARRKNTQRRGEGAAKEDIDEFEIAAPMASDELLALDAALSRFSAIDPEKAELVKLKFFVGLTTEEAAALLDISEPTAKRYWAFSRAWLFREIGKTTEADKK